jgi:glycosyltransferase involved in cell wall biosynthesis
MLLSGARARAYLINDHEPEFYPASVESFWAEQTYKLGLYGICASPWLRDLYVGHYGGAAGYFELGVDHNVYRPRPIDRRTDTVMFYCRPPTGRRAFALGRMALRELKDRRPDLRVVTYGARDPVRMSFEYEHGGVASPTQLSWLYSQSTVGLCMSMTNYSLIPQEMLACGLPCVELRHPSTEGVFGLDGPVSLAPFRPTAIADALDALLSDEELWQRRSAAGLKFVADKSWENVAEIVERELREALRLRECGQEEVIVLPADLQPGAGRDGPEGWQRTAARSG